MQKLVPIGKKSLIAIQVLIGLVFIAFSVYSYFLVGWSTFNISLFLWGCGHILLSVKFFDKMLTFIASEYFIVGLLIFFIVGFDTPDGGEGFFSGGGDLRLFLGALIFIFCCACSSILLRSKPINKKHK